MASLKATDGEALTAGPPTPELTSPPAEDADRRATPEAVGSGAGLSPSAEGGASTDYVPEIDALRAVAAIAVVAFHASIFDAGWMGVWLFFVISGFAVTTSLLKSEWETGASRGVLLRNFYFRRALRIWPLYYVYMLIAAACAAAWGFDWHEVYLPWVATFTTNLRPIFLESPSESEWLPFAILWSLAVEEQFYLVWPLAFLLAPRRWLPYLLGAALLLVPLLRWELSAAGLAAGWSSHKTGYVTYTFAPAHFDAFAAGCLIALARRWVGRRRIVAILTVAAAVVAAAYSVNYYLLDQRELFEGERLGLSRLYRIFAVGMGQEVFLYSVLWMVSAAVLLNVLARERLVTSFCRLPGLQVVGRVSFGIYVFHTLIMEALLLYAVDAFGGERSWAASMLFFLTTLTLSAGAAFASHRFLERPVLRLKHRFA